jgi:hypothetical protein
MSKLSLSIAANDIPINTLLEILLPLPVSAHHIEIKGKHGDMHAAGHLKDRPEIRVYDLVLVLEIHRVVDAGQDS